MHETYGTIWCFVWSHVNLVQSLDQSYKVMMRQFRAASIVQTVNISVFFSRYSLKHYEFDQFKFLHLNFTLFSMYKIQYSCPKRDRLITTDFAVSLFHTIPCMVMK